MQHGLSQSREHHWFAFYPSAPIQHHKLRLWRKTKIFVRCLFVFNNFFDFNTNIQFQINRNFFAALKSVSMGQGQEYHARKMMSECMAAGGWVLLQNVHLSLTFCSEIIDILVETEHVEDSFRLWVTTEVHEEFPIGLLQMAIKFTNEPPQGIRASLKRSYQVI